MGFVNSSTLPVTSTSNTTTVIANETIALADTEQSYALPSNCKCFRLRARGATTTVRLAFSSGDTSTVYWTVFPGSVYVNENFYTSQTIYFRADVASDIIEIEAHS